MNRTGSAAFLPEIHTAGIKGNYPNTVNPLLGGGDLPGYQAGSVFKMFTMVAALEQGVIRWDDVHELGTIEQARMYKNVILYLKSPDDLHPIRNQDTTLQDNLSLLLSPADHPVLFVALSFIGLTWLYYVWLRAKGLHYGGTKVSSGAGWGVSIMLYILLLLFAVASTALFPGFVS